MGSSFILRDSSVFIGPKNHFHNSFVVTKINFVLYFYLELISDLTTGTNLGVKQYQGTPVLLEHLSLGQILGGNKVDSKNTVGRRYPGRKIIDNNDTNSVLIPTHLNIREVRTEGIF